MEKIWKLKLENGSMLEARSAPELELSLHDICVFRRDFLEDLGEITVALEAPTMTSRVEELPAIQRKAVNAELATANENFRKARSAMPTIQQWIDKLDLKMNPVNAHYSLDSKLLTIQFCADGRVDFRELVKELSRALSTRIELRQIGVRDETGIFGGIGVCGQPLCCSKFLREFNSINVKMAKEQDLALTPATISGVCGRLKCCLKFEHAGYLELEKGMPRKGEFCETPSGKGRITDRNLLTRKVTVTFENSSSSTFSVEEITVCAGERRSNQPSQRKEKNAEKYDSRPRREKNGNPARHGSEASAPDPQTDSSDGATAK